MAQAMLAGLATKLAEQGINTSVQALQAAINAGSMSYSQPDSGAVWVT